MIGVEDGDVVARGAIQGEVDVARLGVVVYRTGDVSAADFRRKLAELFTITIIENVNLQLVGRPIHV